VYENKAVLCKLSLAVMCKTYLGGACIISHLGNRIYDFSQSIAVNVKVLSNISIFFHILPTYAIQDCMSYHFTQQYAISIVDRTKL